MNTNDKDDTKIGAGHAQAFLRMGLNELRNAVYPDSNVAQRYPEQGLYGTATPQEVMDSKLVEGPSLGEDKGSFLDERIREVERQTPLPDEESREMERG